ncbi:MAG: DUF503 domain-containing protein [Candidatus Aminicenantes bacterium]|nr:DUF503 domain-containing protein [Candidatus Aminicenantes bacterium]MDH5466135.1 DUF503 domain-containing protein [Candidatus Aminicenantes bacterium]MDH5704480.1 DUF503 domain-containing protein [Candidatus Aminicenantes bacterium]
MVIGFLSIEIYLPYSHSLKDKRKRLSGLRSRLTKKYNVAISELEYQNKWQRTKIGMVSLNSQKRPVESLFSKIIEDVEKNIDGQILDYETHYF